MSQLTKLFEPGKIGKMELKNRLVMAPMATSSHGVEGFVMENTAEYYRERAKGGVGLIITQSSACLREGRSPGRPGTWDDKFIPGLKKVADAVHECGGKIAWQVVYHGKLLSGWLDRIPWRDETLVIGPSAIPWVRTGIAPKEATKEDIELIVEGFSEGARRIKAAGFDAVEVHGAHGYAITQWLSPRDNRRTDEYGGSVEKRARLACDIIRRIRRKVGPDFPIIFRFSGSDFLEGGITIEDSVRQAPLFVEAGADALSVSASEDNSTQWQFLSHLFPDGAIVHLAQTVKKAVNVPVITTGKIWDPLFAERILQEGKADFVGMGRALLADPELPNKAKAGKLEEIRRCIYCNNCMDRLDIAVSAKAIPKGMDLSRGLNCTVNPALFREREFDLKPTASPKRIMVIGGGLAGMEAARVLAERGHQVCLYEKSGRLGGQWNIASQQPSKKAFASVTERLVRGLDQAGVKVTLNQGATAQMVKEAKPDAVVVATGATPATLDVLGADGSNVVQAIDVLAGKASVGQSVVVIGGRHRGMEVALRLAEQGKKVSLVSRRRLGRDIERNIYRELRNRLIERGVYLYPHSSVEEIRGNGVHIGYERDLVFLRADTVVLAVGARPENRLAEELKDSGLKVYAIGDCAEPRDAMDAIREGAEIGREI